MNVFQWILGTLPKRRARFRHARPAAMGKPWALACGLACAALASGCGQKGPLYLPSAAEGPSLIVSTTTSHGHPMP